jgi:NADPH2:quinone reductase
MKIVQFAEPGPPDVLRVVEVPVPKPAAGQILVKAHWIGVGIPDILIRSGAYAWMPKLPCTPGTEMSGTIEAVGTGVTQFKAGQKVIVSAREREERGGCYAEYIAVEETAAYALPDGIDMEGAACLANYQVAWHVLWSAARAHKGETVLLYAAAGGVGNAVVDLAKGAGLSVIGVVSNDKKATFARDLGCAHIIDRSREDVGKRVAEITGGRGVDVIVDPVGGPTFLKHFDMLAPLGIIVHYGHLGGKADVDLSGAMRKKFGDSPAVRAFSMHSFDHWPEKRRECTLDLIDQLAKGRIRPKVDDRLPLAQAAEAHRRLEAGDVLGKLLLKP